MVYAALMSQWMLAGVFAAAALSKVRSSSAFAAFVVSTGRLLPPRLTRWRQPAAVGVVAVEMATVVLLMVPVTMVVGFGVAALLAGGFAVRLTVAVLRREDVTCNCFGSSTTPVEYPHVARNLLLVTVALLGLVAAARGVGDTPQLPVVAIVVGGALVAAAVVIRLDDLVALFARYS